MGLAILYPEPEKGGRGKVGALKEARKLGGFSGERVRQARAVLRHSLELAHAVRDGTMALDDALDIVKNAKQAIENDEAKLARLRTGAS